MRGYQTQRQTISQLRQRDTSSRNSVSRDDEDEYQDDDDDDDDTAEFLQSNLRAHHYRKQQINTLAFLLCDSLFISNVFTLLLGPLGSALSTPSL